MRPNLVLVSAGAGAVYVNITLVAYLEAIPAAPMRPPLTRIVFVSAGATRQTSAGGSVSVPGNSGSNIELIANLDIEEVRRLIDEAVKKDAERFGSGS